GRTGRGPWSRTAGGARVAVRRAPGRRRRPPQRRAEIAALAQGDPAAALALLAGPRGWVDLDAFLRDRALGAVDADRLKGDLELIILAAAGRKVAMLPAAWNRFSADVGGTLDAFHASRPDLPGIGLELLRKQLSPALPAPVFLAAVRRLAEAREAVVDRSWVRRPAHEVRFSAEEERIWVEIQPRLAEAPYR